MCVSSKWISPSDSILTLLLWVNSVCLPMAEMHKKNKSVNKHFVQRWPRDGLAMTSRWPQRRCLSPTSYGTGGLAAPTRACASSSRPGSHPRSGHPWPCLMLALATASSCTFSPWLHWPPRCPHHGLSRLLNSYGQGIGVWAKAVDPLQIGWYW